MIKKLTGLTASVVALASTAHAEVKINDYLSLSGYAVAAATLTEPDRGSNYGSQFDSGWGNLDSVKFALTGKYNDLSGKVSLFYTPGAPDEAGILDAYATYAAGPVSFTGGKFLSYLGYEAWDPINMTTLTYGDSWTPIPGYHSGAKVDYTGDGFTLGAAVTDSLYMDYPNHFYGGDGDFSNGLGYEFVGTYTGIEKLTVFAGLGIEDPDNAHSSYVFDFWTSYALSTKLTVAGEYSFKDDGVAGTTSDYWAAFATYAFTDKISATGRISGVISDEPGTQLTFAPAYTFNENFTVRAEVSYYDSDEAAPQAGIMEKGFFYGIQGVFKF